MASVNAVVHFLVVIALGALIFLALYWQKQRDLLRRVVTDRGRVVRLVKMGQFLESLALSLGLKWQGAGDSVQEEMVKINERQVFVFFRQYSSKVYRLSLSKHAEAWILTIFLTHELEDPSSFMRLGEALGCQIKPELLEEKIYNKEPQD